MPQEIAGLETTVTLQAVFANPSLAEEVTRSTQILDVNPRVLRIVFSWRQPASPIGNPWPIPQE
jgi:hypothetical protein